MTIRFGALGLLAALALAGCGGEEPGSGDAPGGTQGAEGGAAGSPDAPPQLEDLGHARGSQDAPITVVEFSDFGCPYCATFAEETYPELHEEFVATGEVRWVFVPFVLGTFPNGELAARAAECAGDEGRFWEMKDELYAAQGDWRGMGRDGATELFQQLGETSGAEGASYSACLDEDSIGERIALHTQAARSVGVRATPSFVVDGHLVEGALAPEHFRMILEQVSGTSN